MLESRRFLGALPHAPHCVVHCAPVAVDPRNVEAFDWDDASEEGNVAELAAHHITPNEAEQVIRDDIDAQVLQNKNLAAGRWFVIGKTHGGRSIRLSVLWTDESSRLLRVVTGWEES